MSDAAPPAPRRAPVAAPNDSNNQQITPTADPILDREYALVEQITQESQIIAKWHDQFVGYLRARLQPILIQLKEIHVQLADGQRSLECLDELLDQLIVIYEAQRKAVGKLQMNGKPLSKTPGNKAVTTESGQTDPATLQLAALTSQVYTQIIQDDAMLDILPGFKKEIKPLFKEYKSKHLFAHLEIFEQYEKQAFLALKQYTEGIAQYKSLLDVFGAEGILAYDKKGKTRPNLHILKHIYIRKMQQYYTKHLILCKLMYEQIQIYSDEDQMRSTWMSHVILKITEQKVLYYGTLHQQFEMLKQIQITHATAQAQRATKFITTQKLKYRQEQLKDNKTNKTQPIPIITYITDDEKNNKHFIQVNPTLPSPIPDVFTSSTTTKYFGEGLDPQFIDLHMALASAQQISKPNVFPTTSSSMILNSNNNQIPKDSTILLQTTCKTGSVLSTEHELLYTTSHHILIIPIKKTQKMLDELEKDFEKNIDKSLIKIKITPPPDSNNKTKPVITTNEANDILTNAQNDGTIEKPFTNITTLQQLNNVMHTFGDADEIIDATILIASKSNKKDDQIILKEKKSGVFSIQHEYKLTLPTPAIADEWIKLINQYSYVVNNE